jgi:hypothetical protein
MTKVIVNTSTGYRVAISGQQGPVVRTVGLQNIINYSNTVNNIYPEGASRLVDLLDVDSSDSDNNEVLVFDEGANTYVVKPLPGVDGGDF